MSTGNALSSAIVQLTESATATTPAKEATAVEDKATEEPSHLMPWSGPLVNWAEVRGHQGLLTASAIDPATGRGCHRHLLIAVEPDDVFVQPLPVHGQPCMLSAINGDVYPQEKQSTDNGAVITENNVENKTPEAASKTDTSMFILLTSVIKNPFDFLYTTCWILHSLF